MGSLWKISADHHGIKFQSLPFVSSNMADYLAIGVHLGATTSCVAVSADGNTTIIANDAGDRVTPAMVAFSDTEKNVGLPAKQGLIRNARNTILRAKRVLGKSYSDSVVQEEAAALQCKLIDKDGLPYYEVESNERNIQVSPKEVINMIYKKMLETAQSHCGSSSNHVVLTVPVNFQEKEVSLLREAAEEAGFHILRIINEPVAAALAYGLGQNDRSQDSTVLVYRLGGASHDVTLLSVINGMYKVLATEYDGALGGRNFDEVLLDLLANDFKRKWKIDPLTNKRSKTKLQTSAEQCKNILSTLESANCSVDSLCEGIDFQGQVSRAKFESSCSSLFQRCLGSIEKVLSSANVPKDEVDKVILVGGATRTPKIQQLLKNYFVGKEICRRISPDEVVAYGAAVQASILMGRKEADMITEIETMSKAICVSVGGESSRMIPVIPQYCPYPLRRAHTFTTATDDQESVCLSIYEVEDPQDARAANSVLLAKIVLRDLPAQPKGELKFTATFHVKKDGSLHVHLMEKTTNRSADVNIDAT